MANAAYRDMHDLQSRTLQSCDIRVGVSQEWMSTLSHGDLIMVGGIGFLLPYLIGRGSSRHWYWMTDKRDGHPNLWADRRREPRYVAANHCTNLEWC